jgi:hypothetical protein
MVAAMAGRPRLIGRRVLPAIAVVAVEHRLRLLTEDHKPDFSAVGRAGFHGYLVFGFTDKGL